MINQLRLLGKKWLRIYEVGQVWDDVFQGKVTVVQVYPDSLVLEGARGRRTFITKGFAKACLK